jgi:hypothetical protein
MNPRLARVKEVAEKRGVDPRTVYGWVAREFVTAYKIGHTVWVDLDSVDAAFTPQLMGKKNG